MTFFILVWLLGAVLTTISSAAVLPHVRADPSSSLSIQCAPSTIISMVTTTVHDIPATVTIAIENASAIASSLSWDASIDTEQVSQQSEMNPISNSHVVETHTFVHTIVVPAFEATEAFHTGSSVYYVSVGPNTTDWSYTPTGKITVGVTTVTVLPVASTSQPQVTTTRDSVQQTTHTAFSMSSNGWNSSASGEITVNGLSTGSVGASPKHVTTVSTTVHTVVTTRVTINVTASTITSSPIYTPLPYGYGSEPSNISSPSFEGYGYPILPRQTCVLISANISGAWATWCNNWDGSATLTYTSWETTVTPSNIPGISRASNTGNGGTSTVSSASTVSPTYCGEAGPFEIGFDDLPVFDPPNNNTDNFPPIFNPFEHFWWGDGWAYVPPPNEPFPPQNGTHLAEFIPSLANVDTGSPNAGLIPNSSFGAGPRNYNDVYWFDAKSVWVGCDNGADDPSITCDFVATGYQWDPVSQEETVAVTQHFPQAPCPNYQNCELSQIFFNPKFQALTTLSFYANVQGDLKIFWIDSLDLDWYNNTCAAGLARISARKI